MKTYSSKIRHNALKLAVSGRMQWCSENYDYCPNCSLVPEEIFKMYDLHITL